METDENKTFIDNSIGQADIRGLATRFLMYKVGEFPFNPLTITKSKE